MISVRGKINSQMISVDMDIPRSVQDYVYDRLDIVSQSTRQIWGNVYDRGLDFVYELEE